ncbi:MAG: amidase family protein, partial [Anaerolineales bacterium]
EAPRELALKDLRVAFAPTFPGVPAAPALRAAVEDLARRLAAAGARVDEAPLPKLDYQQELAEAGALIGLMMGAFQPQPGGQPATLAQYLAALHRRDQSIRAWEQFFAEYDLLLCPPAMLTAFPHTDTGAALSVAGQPTDYWMVSAHTVLFNYTGHPAVGLPTMRDGAGLPVGVQLVGKRWGEARLLAAAKAISQLAGEFQRPPGY